MTPVSEKMVIELLGDAELPCILPPDALALTETLLYNRWVALTTGAPAPAGETSTESRRLLAVLGTKLVRHWLAHEYGIVDELSSDIASEYGVRAFGHDVPVLGSTQRHLEDALREMTRGIAMYLWTLGAPDHLHLRRLHLTFENANAPRPSDSPIPVAADADEARATVLLVRTLFAVCWDVGSSFAPLLAERKRWLCKMYGDPLPSPPPSVSRVLHDWAERETHSSSSSS
jgi:hypothetical protein